MHLESFDGIYKGDFYRAVGITKFNDNAAITGLLGYREGNRDTLKLTKYISGEVTRTQNFARPTLLF